MVDLYFYCERTGPGLLAEPLNTATNIAFFVAAWQAWALGRRLKALSAGVWFLIVFLFLIGVASTLNHTTAAAWARRFDVGSILTFELYYLWLYARSVMELKTGGALGAVVALLAAVGIADQFSAVFNGSLSYAPALIVLAALGLYHLLRKKAGPFLLLLATGVFFVSLFFRTVDRAFCPSLPVGTHFLWHLLNGAVLYLCMRALLLNGANSEAVEATSLDRGF